MSRRAVQLTTLGVSAAVALTAAALFWRSRAHSRGTVELRDYSEAFARLLAERQGDAPPEGQLYEPADKAELIEFLRQRGELTERDRESRGVVPDPVLFVRREPFFRRTEELPDGSGRLWTLTTNSLGMRGPEPLENPDLRLLVTGDSHTDGVCDDDRTFTAILGRRLAAARGLRVDALNAGLAGYNPYHYLAVLERWADELEPDVFVAVVFGGNDFSGLAKYQRFFTHRGPFRTGYTIRELKRAGVDVHGYRGQGLISLGFFLANPDEEEVAARTLCDISAEMRRLCDERGIALVLAYLPEPMQGQPHLFADVVQGVRRAWRMNEEPYAYLDRMADTWLAWLEQEGIAHLDLRPAFRACQEPLYWPGDKHLDHRGHELVARRLEPVVAAARPASQ